MIDSLIEALVITKREVRDQFRDWRIVVPIILLTIFFPALMNFTAHQAVNFVERHNAPIVGDRLIPFLLMVVGFFPISVSLVIALESFVGEKERRSIEPLLCSPLSDWQLYLGKLLAAMVPPLLASYLGIAVYLIAVRVQIGWKPDPTLLIQILLLTTVQAITMVSGAVVLSSQTTSTRAANLLASFIIIPFALLIQGESIVMFWAVYRVLWWVILAQVLISILLVRTGVAYFNREEMLGRELDSLNIGWGWRLFISEFIGSAKNLFEWYRSGVIKSIQNIWIAGLVTTIALIAGVFVGNSQSSIFQIPPHLLSFDQMNQGFIEGLDAIRFFSTTSVTMIWWHNIRVILLATVLGIFSFGILGLLVIMFPLIFIGYIFGNVAAAGLSTTQFLAGLILPHALLEIPALILAGAAILNLGATLTAPAEGKTIGEAWIISLAKWAKIMLGFVIPLLLGAALIEVFITPKIAVVLFGG
jgi:uncharacterized membrane protein SpoIIM required for sporulation